ncbi:hypothetical protein [Deinococcus sp. S9]|uniref:hypothetical protein n=1 Tax=Deinococcus sp. S9 TaxID=2545754 RepID=UPI001054E511|nr:hypothetical protein [Deinococcus sp. S9]TDE85133.1 hypothetical protein E0686_13495 [Deinococcus sp. S9]
MAGPEPRLIDLRTAVPADWSLTGLSAPQWDGVNYYRAPSAPFSRLTFTTAAPRFVQFRYQLFAPEKAVTGRVFLNGHLLDTFTFPAGKFVNREATGYTRAGDNTLVVEYLCGSSVCRNVPLRQYWSQVTLAKTSRARTDVGLGIERWILDAPGSPLSVQGTGKLLFDNENYFRFVNKREFTLSWPKGTRVLDASFQVSADEPFRVTVRMDGQIVMQKRGDRTTSVAPTLSLVGYPRATSLQVQVDCLSRHQDCARLYFTRASVVPPEVAAPPTLTTLLVTGGLVLLVLLLLAWGLRLLPAVDRVRG